MFTRMRLSVLAVAGFCGAFGILIGPHETSAGAASPRTVTLRVGDRVVVPTVGQTCKVEVEVDAPELLCSKRSGWHHRVVFFSDQISVYRVGRPDNAVWFGRP